MLVPEYLLNNPGGLEPVLLFSATNWWALPAHTAHNFTNFLLFFVLIRGWFLLRPMICPHFLRRYVPDPYQLQLTSLLVKMTPLRDDHLRLRDDLHPKMIQHPLQRREDRDLLRAGEK